jgi:zinc transport system substrate-binding protein
MRRLWLTLLLVLCSPAWSQTVVVSVEPLAKVLRSLYGDSVTVTTLLQANQNPHQLALSPRQALAVQQADLMVWLGAGVEAPLAPLVARRKGPSVALLALESVRRRHGGHDHDHDEHASHDATIDPHLWLSVDNMVLLAAAVGQRFPAGLKPGQPQQWQQAAKAQLQAEREKLAPLAQVPWLSYHQPWGYLSESLALAEPLVVSEQLDAGPGSRRFVTLAGQVRDRQVRCAMQEPEARIGLLKRLCPDCYVQPQDPLGRDSAQLEYLPWLSELSAGFSQCLRAAKRG